ncbi:MAG: PQQ-dependent sugar dehydrogenase [Bdellovibrionales bacterium]|nr:PQQ-dependent sugar dehydrogenase [Bdellovibrionales bacterium]
MKALLAVLLSLSTYVSSAENSNDPEIPQPPPTSNVPTLVPATEQLIQSLQLPSGFTLSVYARDLGHPRMMALAPDGAIYISRTEEGDIVRLYDSNADGTGDVLQSVLTLPTVHGIAIVGTQMYMVTEKELLTTTINTDGSLLAPTVILSDLPDGGHHGKRTIQMGPDGYLYISIGSSCNACVEVNDQYATIIRVRPDGSERLVYASGLRNTEAFSFHPITGQLWGADNSVDELGSNFPGEELNKIIAGQHYGWPFVIDDGKLNPLVDYPVDAEMSKEEFLKTIVNPTLLFTPHSAPITLSFYSAPAMAFPEKYHNGAFVTFHGSWNASPAVGFEVAFVPYINGEPTAAEPFLTGFLSPDKTTQFGRPTGLLVLSDGSLLVSEDGNGLIYRITTNATPR